MYTFNDVCWLFHIWITKLMYRCEVLLQSQGLGALLILRCHLPRLMMNLEASGMSFSRLSTGRTEINLSQKSRCSAQDSNLGLTECVRHVTAWAKLLLTKWLVASVAFVVAVVLVRSGVIVVLINLSMALQPLRALAAFSVSYSILIRQDSLNGGISPSKGRYLHTEQHKHKINAHRHLCLERDSNPRSQCSSGRRLFML
jgi:hypothetical protein